MGQCMSSYRIYILDSGNHIQGPPKIVECDSDQEALQQAQAMVDGRDVELWDGNRLVARLPHDMSK